MIHAIPMTEAVADLLRRNAIFPKRPQPVDDLTGIKTLRFSSELAVSPMTRHHMVGGDMVLNSLGFLSYAHSALHSARSGSFCSIATGIRIMGMKHPIERVTTHPVTYGPYYSQTLRGMLGGAPAITQPFAAEQGPIRLEHDVWIAEQAVLSGGITLGTGSVVLSDAVVTKDVPPYAIVAGVPAKVVRHRFAPELVQRLLDSRWWDYRLTDLKRFAMADPAAFCDAFERAAPGLEKRIEKTVTARDLLDAAKG